MAHFERTFHMDHPPDQAQALFLRDVGPAFAQDAEFLLQHEQPGELLFSEGDLGLPPGPLDEGLPFGNREIHAAETSTATRRFGGGPDGLARAFAAHIKVEFTPDGEGTRVELKGHAEHSLRQAIDRLGTPGHCARDRERPTLLIALGVPGAPGPLPGGPADALEPVVFATRFVLEADGLPG